MRRVVYLNSGFSVYTERNTSMTDINIMFTCSEGFLNDYYMNQASF